MASTITTILITALAATVANAGFSAWGDNNFPSWGSSIPSLPDMNLPLSPPLLFSNLPPLPTLPGFNFEFPPMPTPQDIMKQGAKPGTNFSGVAVISQSHASIGPDGQIQKDGQATVVTNDNGNVTVEKLNGDGTIVIISKSSNKDPPFSDYKTPEFKSSHFKMPKFEPITMKPFHMKPFTMKPFIMKPFTIKPIPTIDPAIIRDYVPQKGEKFTGSSYSVETHFSDVNGVKKSGGSSSSVLNDNGSVEAKDVFFSDNPQ